MKYDESAKKAFDVTAAAVGLVLCSPILLLAITAVRWTSPGPGIFAQTRVGLLGRTFTLYKLRTMYVTTDNHLPTHQVARSSITPLGSMLRATKLDELPQLVNVLRGDMSLVGPRPCLPSQTDLIEARRREGALAISPGITGLAQMQGIDMSDPARLAKIDGDYARTRSFAGDIRILLATVIGGRGIGHDPAKPTGA